MARKWKTELVLGYSVRFRGFCYEKSAELASNASKGNSSVTYTWTAKQ